MKHVETIIDPTNITATASIETTFPTYIPKISEREAMIIWEQRLNNRDEN